MPYSAHKNFLCQTALAQGHRRFGPTDPRKEDDEGGGARSHTPEGQAIPPHPLLAQAAQFSGDDKLETVVTADNEEIKEAYELELAHRHDKQLQNANQKVSSPTLKP